MKAMPRMEEIEENTLDDYGLIINSLKRPQGLFEIYDVTGIGHYPSSRIETLESVSKQYKNLVDRYGLAMNYGIHQDTIRLQLIATQSNAYPLTHSTQGAIRVLRAPQMLEELARFSYRHRETAELGEKINAGEDVGPLEHEILQEMKVKDQQFGKVRATVGRYMHAIGNFAEVMAERRLSID